MRTLLLARSYQEGDLMAGAQELLAKPELAIASYRSILAQRSLIQDAGFIARVLHNLGLALNDIQEYEEAPDSFYEAHNHHPFWASYSGCRNFDCYYSSQSNRSRGLYK